MDKDAQVAHANIAIVSSGVVGKGPGKSVERDFLAQAFSDFIFAIVIEELGLLGAAFVVFLYIILLYRCARIASQCENNFPAFLAMGLGLLLVVQAALQHDGSCRTGSCYRSALAAHFQRWYVDNYQLRLYWDHSKRQPFGKNEKRKRINAKCGWNSIKSSNFANY